MENKHFDPGAVRTDRHPADPVAELERIRKKPDLIKCKNKARITKKSADPANKLIS
jgi:hypothetical protein